VGIMSIVAFTFCGSLSALSFAAQRRLTDRCSNLLNETTLAKYHLAIWMNMLCLTLASLALLLSYHAPVMLGTCMCHELFILTIAFYVMASYTMKLSFLLHTHLIFLILDLSPNRNKERYFHYKSLVALCIALGAIVLILIGSFSDGACLEDSGKGCSTSFARFGGYVAMALVGVDVLLLTAYMRMVCVKLQTIGVSPAVLLQQFRVHWLLAMVSMAVSMLDIAVNTADPSYDSLSLLSMDCMVMALCNFLGFSPAQHFVKRVCCHCCCRIVRANKAGIDKGNEPKVMEIQINEHEAPVLQIEALECCSMGANAIDTRTLTASGRVVQSADQAAVRGLDKLSVPGRYKDKMNVPLVMAANHTQDHLTQSKELTSVCSSALSDSAVAVRCPECNKLIIIHDDENRWDMLRKHIKWFHVPPNLPCLDSQVCDDSALSYSTFSH